jgi:hypothetical protein
VSDERTAYLIKDRLSFMRFLRLTLADAVPDANTIWTFREALTCQSAPNFGSDSLLMKFRRWLVWVS